MINNNNFISLVFQISGICVGYCCLKMNCNDNDCNNCTTRIMDCGHQHVLHSYVDPKEFKCPTRIKTTLPCGHETSQKPCHIDVKEWKCNFPCKARIDSCGHSCIRTCHVNHDPDHLEYKCYKTCDRISPDCSTETHKCPRFCHQKCAPCRVIVAKKLPNCNHTQDLKCRKNSNNIVCMEPCTKQIAECHHNCKRKCHEPCGGCEEIIIKTFLTCIHEVKTTCSKPNIKNCGKPCSKQLPCGHLCKKKCNEVCTDVCNVLVNDVEPTFCGHQFKIPCHLQKQKLPNYSILLLPYCKEPCSTVLQCSHKCAGNCGECAQGRIHYACEEESTVSLICEHKENIRCPAKPQPCKLKCDMKCSHNECSKTCGEVCTKCQESCTRRCIHAECTAACGDNCTVSPCEEPCEKKLPCLHPCVGYCGDPCPPLCRICNADELLEVFLGYEDEVDARFVLLDECKHVIENKGLKIYWNQNQDGEKVINYRRCPKCKTLITSTQRYSDYVKQVIKDVAVIKSNRYGSYTEIQEKRIELQEKLIELNEFQQSSGISIFLTDEGISNFKKNCTRVISNNGQMFNLIIGKSLELQLTIAQIIGNIFDAQKLNVSQGRKTISSANVVFSEASAYVKFVFSRLEQKVGKIFTNQEKNDFKQELVRLQRIAQLVKIAEILPSSDHEELSEVIYKPIVYTEDYDKKVKSKLEERYSICPNGHIYAIGEIGGAITAGKCKECRAQKRDLRKRAGSDL